MREKVIVRSHLDGTDITVLVDSDLSVPGKVAHCQQLEHSLGHTYALTSKH